jgi:hypothetical protein
MKRMVAEDGALIDQASHWDTNFISGRKFPADFPVPVTFDLDVDSEGRRMPTLFTVPAFVARRTFADVLKTAGVDNIDIYPAVISNSETGERIGDYVLINIVGTAACADLGASQTIELGEDLRMIDRPVLRQESLPDAHMFRLAEDPLQIIVSDAVVERVRGLGLQDVHFEPVEINA